MTVFCDSEDVLRRFDRYAADLRRLFVFHGLACGKAENFCDLALKLEESKALREDLPSLLRHIRDLEREAISANEMLTLVALASGGEELVDGRAGTVGLMRTVSLLRMMLAGVGTWAEVNGAEEEPVTRAEPAIPAEGRIALELAVQELRLQVGEISQKISGLEPGRVEAVQQTPVWPWRPEADETPEERVWEGGSLRAGRIVRRIETELPTSAEPAGWPLPRETYWRSQEEEAAHSVPEPPPQHASPVWDPETAEHAALGELEKAQPHAYSEPETVEQHAVWSPETAEDVPGAARQWTAHAVAAQWPAPGARKSRLTPVPAGAQPWQRPGLRLTAAGAAAMLVGVGIYASIPSTRHASARAGAVKETRSVVGAAAPAQEGAAPATEQQRVATAEPPSTDSTDPALAADLQPHERTKEFAAAAEPVAPHANRPAPSPPSAPSRPVASTRVSASHASGLRGRTSQLAAVRPPGKLAPSAGTAGGDDNTSPTASSTNDGGAQGKRFLFVPAAVMEKQLLVARKAVPPPEVSAGHLSGRVVLNAFIAKDGTVKRTDFVEGPPQLVSSAMAAVSWRRYRPFLLRGKPAEVVTPVTVSYNTPQ